MYTHSTANSTKNSRIKLILHPLPQILQTQSSIRTKASIHNLTAPTIGSLWIATHAPGKIRQSISLAAIAHVITAFQFARHSIVTRQFRQRAFLHDCFAREAGVAGRADALVEETPGGEDFEEGGEIGSEVVAIAAIEAG